MSMLSAALAAQRIVEVGDTVAGSFCGKLLADLGAEVIRIEPPEGSWFRKAGPFAAGVPVSGLHAYLNAGKLGLTLNLGTDSGQRLLRDLLHVSDCLIVARSAPPSPTESDPIEVGKSVGDLLVTAVTPFGLVGDYANVPGSETTVQAVSGLLGVTPKFPDGTDREPLKLPGHVGSYLAGLHAAASTLAALFSGRHGICLDISEVDAQMACYTPVFSQYETNPNLQFSHQIPTSGWYITKCRDGYVMISALMDEPWERLKDALGRPEWAESPAFKGTADRNQNFDALRLALQPWLDQHDRKDLFERFQSHGGTSSPIYAIDEAVQSPQLAFRRFFTPIDVAQFGESVLMPGSAFAGGNGSPVRRAPLLGEHNEHLLKGLLAVSSDRMAELRAEGAIV